VNKFGPLALHMRIFETTFLPFDILCNGPKGFEQLGDHPRIIHVMFGKWAIGCRGDNVLRNCWPRTTHDNTRFFWKILWFLRKLKFEDVQNALWTIESFEKILWSATEYAQYKGVQLGLRNKFANFYLTDITWSEK
jgi:hypothetical protein